METGITSSIKNVVSRLEDIVFTIEYYKAHSRNDGVRYLEIVSDEVHSLLKEITYLNEKDKSITIPLSMSDFDSIDKLHETKIKLEKIYKMHE